MYSIYAWSFGNTIKYVGLTKNVQQRKSRYLRKGKPSYTKLKSLRKIHFGMRDIYPLVPDFIILRNEISTLEEARKIESEYIRLFNTIKDGYNVAH